MEHSIDFMVMSGVDDGSTLRYSTQSGDGTLQGDSWTLTIGRLDNSDIRLGSDTFVSREHARVHWRNSQWWLEDLNSRNGTYVLNAKNFFDDSRVNGIVPVEVGQLFRIGRTWLRIQPSD